MQISAIKDFVWHGVFDVIVIGFGGAGATSARFAADQGSKVLLLDVAPAGHEGGNTRYCGQLIGGTKDAANFQCYYEHLAAPFKLDQELITTFTKGVSEMENYLSRYLSVTPFSFQAHRNHETVQSVAADFPDYPEYPAPTPMTSSRFMQVEQLKMAPFGHSYVPKCWSDSTGLRFGIHPVLST